MGRGMGLGIVINDWGLELDTGIGIGDLDWGLGFRIGIGIWIGA